MLMNLTNLNPIFNFVHIPWLFKANRLLDQWLYWRQMDLNDSQQTDWPKRISIENVKTMFM